MTFDDQAKQAFASASDWSKQILTLSTGIVTVTVSFSDKIFGPLSHGEKLFLYGSWVVYLVSILGGVWTLSALTGTLAGATEPSSSDVYKSNTRVPAIVQVVAFVLATISIVVFGILAAGNPAAKPAPASSALSASLP
jgi:hypothetical protein